ncbi:MAG TPA: peptidoglycan editing factor PgeF [Burkholderiales bacterium]|nr:peptidoglycan editing factor PgeF [Burkholderiales bacterium]
MKVIRPDWPVPPNVQAVMTTRHTKEEDLRALLPSEPAWLRQVHGIHVVDLDPPQGSREGDAAITRHEKTVCAIRVADCMPVLLSDESGKVIGAAHAGWRGLCAGVIEETIAAMRVPGEKLIAWLGPAIGPKAYEVGDEVRSAFLRRDDASETAFVSSRPGHWLLDLYAVARQRLSSRGVERVFGGGYCTYTDAERFHSYRRDRTSARMAAFVWMS